MTVLREKTEKYVHFSDDPIELSEISAVYINSSDLDFVFLLV